MMPSIGLYILLTIAIATASGFLILANNGGDVAAAPAAATTTSGPASSWSQWSTWSACSESCGVGSRFRARHCDGGNDCIGDVFQQSTCDNHCVVPVDGQWTDWGVWNACSITCGQGTQYRTRTCTNPAPKHGGKPCVGNTRQAQQCKDKECPIDGGWGAYIARPCTVTCGIGVLVSIRHCNNPSPQYGGSGCTGMTTKFEKCTNANCIVDGVWGAWSDYSNCTVVCGEGYTRRSRQCNNPPPQAGGTDCAGIDEEKKVCSSGPCPKDIRTCDKTLSVSPVCSNDPNDDGSGILKSQCKFPDDISKWYLGLKIAENCEMLPLYIPIGAMNPDKATIYGVMMECYNNVVEIMSKSCDNHVTTTSLNLTDHELHVVSYH